MVKNRIDEETEINSIKNSLWINGSEHKNWIWNNVQNTQRGDKNDYKPKCHCIKIITLFLTINLSVSFLTLMNIAGKFLSTFYIFHSKNSLKKLINLQLELWHNHFGRFFYEFWTHVKCGINAFDNNEPINLCFWYFAFMCVQFISPCMWADKTPLTLNRHKEHLRPHIPKGLPFSALSICNN